jgi:hypothetical protein
VGRTSPSSRWLIFALAQTVTNPPNGVKKILSEWNSQTFLMRRNGASVKVQRMQPPRNSWLRSPISAPNYWHIRHPERGRIKFEMREAQVETVKCWIEDRYTIVLKARQIGFSTLAATFAFWEQFFWSDRFTVMLSRTEREAAKLLQKTKYGYKMMPAWIRQRGPDLLSDNQLKMVFANDSAIESLPSGNDPARGESVYRVFIDEMAFIPNAAEAWASIEPIADVGGRVELFEHS